MTDKGLGSRPKGLANGYNNKENRRIILGLIIILWFCVAAWWKTIEVTVYLVKKVPWHAYYKTMDRWDAKVERFWAGD